MHSIRIWTVKMFMVDRSETSLCAELLRSSGFNTLLDNTYLTDLEPLPMQKTIYDFRLAVIKNCVD